MKAEALASTKNSSADKLGGISGLEPMIVFKDI
jgi:hypothetical protein